MRRFILIGLCLFLLSSLVSANGAKPMQDPSGSGGMIFDENSGIALLSEAITFSVLSPAYTTSAVVTVEYDLKNLTTLDQEFNMFFVIPPLYIGASRAPFTVKLEDQDITDKAFYKSMKLPNNWLPKFPENLTDPVDHKPLNGDLEDRMDTAIRSNRRELMGIDIPLLIPAGGNAKLLIEYSCEGGFNRTAQFIKPVFSYIYYLTPASFWEGDPKVKLTLDLPKTQSFHYYSNIPLEKTGYNRYSTELDSLPDHEWLFTFVDKKGILFGTNAAYVHTRITTGIAAAIFILSLYLSKRQKSKAILRIGYIGAVAFFFLFTSNIYDGYILDFFIMAALAFTLMILIPVFHFIREKELKSRELN